MKTAVIVLALCCAAAHVRAADDTAAIETSRHPHEHAEPPAAGPGALGLELLEIRRIHVEPLSGGEAAQQLRDMVISELGQPGLFLLTEDPDRADAIPRG